MSITGLVAFWQDLPNSINGRLLVEFPAKKNGHKFTFRAHSSDVNS